MNTSGEIEQVLEFWLGACGPDGSLDPGRRKMWFGDGRRHDAAIRERFGPLHQRASRGELTMDWSGTPRGRLALVVLLDQFSRYIHRGSAAAFEQDAAAQRLVTEGLARGADADLIPAGRVFFYMPLEHAEDIALQRRSVERFERLAKTVGPEWRKDYEGFLDYARRHRDVIARFGRFPHRNAALRRVSTAEEIEFIAQPGSSF